MKADRAPSSTTEAAPIGLPQSACTGSRRNECHSVCSAHRLPVERTGRYRYLLMQLGIRVLPGMDRCGRVRSSVAQRADPIRQAQGNRLVLACDGWRHDQGACRGLKKTGANPTDRGKQGVKRSLLTEAIGIPIAVAIDGANRHDMKLVRNSLESIMAKRPKPKRNRPQGLCLDKGYDFDEVRGLVKELGFTAHIRARGEEAVAIKQEAGFRARRWVVELTHSWMNRFRRILVRWEKLSETFVVPCCISPAASLLGAQQAY